MEGDNLLYFVKDLYYKVTILSIDEKPLNTKSIEGYWCHCYRSNSTGHIDIHHDYRLDLARHHENYWCHCYRPNSAGHIDIHHDYRPDLAEHHENYWCHCYRPDPTRHIDIHHGYRLDFAGYHISSDII